MFHGSTESIVDSQCRHPIFFLKKINRIILTFLSHATIVINIDLFEKLNMRSLIKSGGGTGPTMPSNRSKKELVLNPAKQEVVLTDKRGTSIYAMITSLF
jgi:hypothetical protein